MVYFIPTIHHGWMIWSDACVTLLRIRACSRSMSRLVHASEVTKGDALASLCVGVWLEKIALDFGEHESLLWRQYRRDDPNHVSSLWEYEREHYGGGMLWDKYDASLGFPRYEAPGGIAYQLLRRPSKWARAYLRLPCAGNRPKADGTETDDAQPLTPQGLGAQRSAQAPR